MTGYHEKFLELINSEIHVWRENASNKYRYEDGFLHGLEKAKELFLKSNK